MSLNVNLNLDGYIDALDSFSPVEEHGRVTRLVGLLIRGTLPDALVGEVCVIRSRRSLRELRAEVVGFSDGRVILMPLGEIHDVAMGAEIIPAGRPLTIRVGDGLLSRVLDGLGEPADKKGPIEAAREWPVSHRPPDPLSRRRIDKVFETRVRAIDGLLTVGEGQRLGIFAAAGVGKSTLLGMLARNTNAEVNVIGLIGERGREVRDFIEEDIGEEGMRRSVVVAATSDEPPLVRIKAAHVATAVAEHFRDQGRRVLLMMDSVTRYARALREVGLAAGEPPGRGGFPPSLSSELAKLLERGGNSDRGSITAFYTVLVEGDDMDEPVADETRSILDGHIVLSRALADRGHFPAIDVNRSISRLMPRVAAPRQMASAQQLREVLAVYEENRVLLTYAGHQQGKNKKLDRAVNKMGEVEALLRQPPDEATPTAETIARLQRIFPA
jgi:FliI/YscN family ATPase